MTKQINLNTKSKQWAKQQEMVKIYSSPFYLATAQSYYLTIIGREGAYIYIHTLVLIKQNNVSWSYQFHVFTIIQPTFKL